MGRVRSGGLRGDGRGTRVGEIFIERRTPRESSCSQVASGGEGRCWLGVGAVGGVVWG